MGGTPVEFWQPWALIPVSYRAGQHHYVPAASFAASWAMCPDTCICRAGKNPRIWTIRQRGAVSVRRPTLAMGHAGVMTVAEAKLHATRTIITHPPYKAPRTVMMYHGKKKRALLVCVFLPWSCLFICAQRIYLIMRYQLAQLAYCYRRMKCVQLLTPALIREHTESLAHREHHLLVRHG